MIPALLLTLFVSQGSDLSAGISLRQEGRIEEAIAFFQQAVARDAGSLEAHRELGHALALGGRYREALEAYGRLAAASDPRWRLQGAQWTGLTRLYLGEIDQALSANEREAELAREIGDRAAEAHARWYRGHVLAELGRFSEANLAFVQAIEIAPDDPNVLHMAGLMAARQNDSGSLRHQLIDVRDAVKRSGDPDQVRRAHHLEGELALLRGEPKEALASFREANRLFPHPLYREAIARAHEAIGELERAEEVYSEILRPSDERLDIPLYYVKALAGMARVLDRQDRRDEAARYYRRLLDHWGSSSEPLPHVAEARKRLAEIAPGP